MPQEHLSSGLNDPRLISVDLSVISYTEDE